MTKSARLPRRMHPHGPSSNRPRLPTFLQPPRTPAPSTHFATPCACHAKCSLKLQEWSVRAVFNDFEFWIPNRSLAKVWCRFYQHSTSKSRPFDPPEPQNIGQTQCFVPWLGFFVRLFFWAFWLLWACCILWALFLLIFVPSEICPFWAVLVLSEWICCISPQLGILTFRLPSSKKYRYM